MAVRRELVFDECVGASRLRRQAHVFLTKQKNKLTRRAGKGIRANPLANCLFLPRGGAGQSIYSALNQLLRLLLSIKIVKNGKSAIIAAMSSTISCSIVLKPCRAINTMITARTTG